MAPRAPQVRRGPETHATTTRVTTHSTNPGIPRAGQRGPCGETGGLGAAAAALSTTPAAALELLGHAMLDRIEVKCCTSLWTFSVSQSACPAASTR